MNNLTTPGYYYYDSVQNISHAPSHSVTHAGVVLVFRMVGYTNSVIQLAITIEGTIEISGRYEVTGTWNKLA